MCAAGALAFVWQLRPHLTLDVTQLVERAVAAFARLPRILTAQIAGCVAHLLGRVAHRRAGLSAAAGILLSGTPFTGWRLLTGSALLTRAALLARPALLP